MLLLTLGWVVSASPSVSVLVMCDVLLREKNKKDKIRNGIRCLFMYDIKVLRRAP